MNITHFNLYQGIKNSYFLKRPDQPEDWTNNISNDTYEIWSLEYRFDCIKNSYIHYTWKDKQKQLQKEILQDIRNSKTNILFFFEPINENQSYLGILNNQGFQTFFIKDAKKCYHALKQEFFQAKRILITEFHKNPVYEWDDWNLLNQELYTNDYIEEVDHKFPYLIEQIIQNPQRYLETDSKVKQRHLKISKMSKELYNKSRVKGAASLLKLV
jgi:hypothetical protein